MNDWKLWLASSETRNAIKTLNEELFELEQAVIDGYMLKHDSADRIAVDYAHKVGAVEGFRQAIQTLKDIEFILNEKESENERS